MEYKKYLLDDGTEVIEWTGNMGFGREDLKRFFATHLTVDGIESVWEEVHIQNMISIKDHSFDWSSPYICRMSCEVDEEKWLKNGEIELVDRNGRPVYDW